MWVSVWKGGEERGGGWMLSGGQVDQKGPGLVIFQAGQEMRQSKGGKAKGAPLGGGGSEEQRQQIK